MDNMHEKMEKFQQIDGDHKGVGQETCGREGTQCAVGSPAGGGVGGAVGVMEETLEQHLEDTMKNPPIV